jgi:hypothetical protein
MFLQGNSVRTHSKHSLRNEEKSPPKSAGVSTGLWYVEPRSPQMDDFQEEERGEIGER